MSEISDFHRAVIEASAQYGSDGKGKGGLNGFVAMLREKYPRKLEELRRAGLLPRETIH
jgi:hypothetical protein